MRWRPDPELSPTETKHPFPFVVPRGVQWAIAIAVAAALLFGPPVLEAIVRISAGIFVLVWGPQWMRLWLATILGVVLVVAGLVTGMALLTT